MESENDAGGPEEVRFVPWPCPLCGSEQTRRPIITKDYNHGIAGTFSYTGCVHCGLWRQQPRPDNATLGRAYPLHYGSSPDVKKNPVSRIRCFANRKRYRFAALPVDTTVSAFDIGCGSGFFLSFLREKGWTVAGIDSAVEHVEYARITLGLTGVDEAQWPGYTGSNEQYDLVSMIHVLEHLSDPVEGLHAASRLLKPGGLLLIETPNVNAFARYLFESRCNLFDAPRHLCLFSGVTIRAAIEAAGLKYVRLTTYSPALDGYIESLRYLLKDAGLRRYARKSGSNTAAQTDAVNREPTGAGVWIKRYMHIAERTATRAVDTIACCFGGGLTLLVLARKGM